VQDSTKIQIQKFKNGDKKAFDNIVINNKDWVISMIFSMVHNKQDAEDISQDVFVSIYFALNRFKGISTFKTWVYRIIINKVNAHYRKLKLKNMFNIELSKVEHVIFSNDDIIFNQFKKEELHKAIISLKGKQRTIVLLRIYQGHTFKEISKLLNITNNSAKVIFYKAKMNLKRKLN